MKNWMNAIKENHPNDGKVLIQGYLLKMGLKVYISSGSSDSIHRVDHNYVVAQRCSSVPYPNFMWHIDGPY